MAGDTTVQALQERGEEDLKNQVKGFIKLYSVGKKYPDVWSHQIHNPQGVSDSNEIEKEDFNGLIDFNYVNNKLQVCRTTIDKKKKSKIRFDFDTDGNVILSTIETLDGVSIENKTEEAKKFLKDIQETINQREAEREKMKENAGGEAVADAKNKVVENLS